MFSGPTTARKSFSAATDTNYIAIRYTVGSRDREISLLMLFSSIYARPTSLYVGGDRDFYDRRPDYVLSGVVKAVERFDSGDVWAAHLAMSMELVRQEDALAVWQKDFDDERQVFFPEMKHTVAAFSQILGQQMETSMREIDFLFFSI